MGRAVSLRRRLAAWMLPPLVLILSAVTWWSYREAERTAGEAGDHTLITITYTVSERFRISGREAPNEVHRPTDNLLAEFDDGRFFYAVFGPDDVLLAGETDLVPPPGLQPASGAPVLADARFRNREVRVSLLETRWYVPEAEPGDAVTLVLAETMEERHQLARQLCADRLTQLFVLIAAVIIVLLFAVFYSVRPFLTLHELIRRRDADDLTPLPTENIPNEIRPLIEAINTHLFRIVHLLETRRRFLTDAAHQIRTPLTVLYTQAEYGERQRDVEEMRRTFASMLASIRDTRHMANQMLTLASAGELAGDPNRERTVLNLGRLVREVAGDFTSRALQKRIELSFDVSPEPQRVEGNATMLREMVANLVDNALRYTPDGGHVTLTVAGAGVRALLRIADDGPGIPPAEREKVFQRFYRVLGSGDSEGSGLGLCIVQEICAAHGGTIRLDDGPKERGLSVEIVLPRMKDW